MRGIMTTFIDYLKRFFCCEDINNDNDNKQEKHSSKVTNNFKLKSETIPVVSNSNKSEESDKVIFENEEDNSIDSSLTLDEDLMNRNKLKLLLDNFINDLSDDSQLSEDLIKNDENFKDVIKEYYKEFNDDKNDVNKVFYKLIILLNNNTKEITRSDLIDYSKELLEMCKNDNNHLPFEKALVVFKTLIMSLNTKSIDVEYSDTKTDYNQPTTIFHNSTEKQIKPDMTNRTFSFKDSLEFFKNLSDQQSSTDLRNNVQKLYLQPSNNDEIKNSSVDKSAQSIKNINCGNENFIPKTYNDDNAVELSNMSEY
ncbi:hypothetical protein A0H76_387 [Hepatospora eriocheir]|uniref:Uncharacterized protein n=1 Tax=Hepatospora eriocheir TaxID=1081669 RepID=A0A1X0QIU1_9MICR|nr:hypothetical protein A0H76_387 [Hepatospora eriocheir]